MIIYKPHEIHTFEKVYEILSIPNFDKLINIYNNTDIIQISTNRIDITTFFYSLKENYWKHLL